MDVQIKTQKVPNYNSAGVQYYNMVHSKTYTI